MIYYYKFHSKTLNIAFKLHHQEIANHAQDIGLAMPEGITQKRPKIFNLQQSIMIQDTIKTGNGSQSDDGNNAISIHQLYKHV